MRVSKRKYDFAGWVTKNDIKCLDGVTIKHNAFAGNDGDKVPLVWNHDYNSPNNVLGHVILENRDLGVYGYGYLNDTQEAENAKKMIQHGDISSMSIGARKIKRTGTDVVEGRIYEVSLVLAGANPGATIETVMQHSDNGDETEDCIITTGTLIHSSDDIIEHKEPEDDKGGKEELEEENKDSGKTIGEVLEGMTQEQKDAVYALVGMVVEDLDKEKNEDTKEDGDDEIVKQNVFNKTPENKNDDVLKHSFNEVLHLAAERKVSSLKDLMSEQKDELKHGINSIEILFPEAYQSTNGNVPLIYKDTNTAWEQILNGVRKSPFARVKTVVADLTEDEARAKGYIKGNMKKEEFFSLIKRKTDPTTVYKKQKLDRDDVIDITDFDVVAFMNVEMDMMLKEEIARALLVGDGRDFSDEDKIDEQHIRPIIGDHEFFTIQKGYADETAFIEAVIMAMADYRGSGRPDMYIDPTELAKVKLLKGTDGRYLFGDIPSDEAIATRLGLRSVIPTTFMTGKGAVIVNLQDYTIGSAKGGEVTNFDDFDIDFNQYKYLKETRLSGALTLPKSAIHLTRGAAGTGADAEKAGVTFGKRQADKETPPAG